MHPPSVMLMLASENGINLFSEHILNLLRTSFQYRFKCI